MNKATLTFQVQAHVSDMGKLIGANGRTAQALRVIVGANAARLHRSLSLDIVNRHAPANGNGSGV